MKIASLGKMEDMSDRGQSEIVVRAEQLSCSYGDFEAVSSIDIEVTRGELFALLGTNGAGKTTTMETLEGHRKPTSGKVSVLGHDPAAERSNIRPRVGIMLQETGFAGDLTVRETVDMWAALSSRAMPTDEALARLELHHRADTRVVQLSGGQKRRLDLVLATLNSPEILFLDEPTSGLDPESRERTWQVVRQLKDAGTTIILTTHYLEEAERYADRIAIMHEGRIAKEGTLASLVGDAAASVSFGLSGGVAAHDGVHEVLEPALVRTEGSRVHIDTHDLQDTLSRLLRWADEADVRLERLRASEASLSEVFAAIGREPVGESA